MDYIGDALLDFSAGGLVSPFEQTYYEFAIDGVPDGQLDYSLELFDNGLLVEVTYEGGALRQILNTDLSFDGLAAPYMFEWFTFYDSGLPLSHLTVFDPGGPLESLEVIFSEDGLITETISVDAMTGDVTRELSGSVGDDVIMGDDDDETFITGLGADVNDGQGGDDIFLLSPLETDGVWGVDTPPNLSIFLGQGLLSNGVNVSFELMDRVLISDTFIGGLGSDKILGSDLDEAVLLYDAAFTPTNSALDSFNARIVGVEEFDLGDGDDMLNLSSDADQLAYLTDAMINGGLGDDYLIGGAGNDNIIGGAGLDRIIGWKGNDVLTGGTAPGVGDMTEDRFLFMPGFAGGTTRITDFEVGTDRIWLVGYGHSDPTNTGSGLTGALGDGTLTITSGATDTVLTVTDGSQTTDIILEGVTGFLSQSDFFFFDTPASAPPATVDNPIVISGTPGDDILDGTDDNDTFSVGVGADVHNGFAGDDTFELTSDIDGIWAAGVAAFINQADLAGVGPVSVPLGGRVIVTDSFIGGTGMDEIVGTSAGEAINLYDVSGTSVDALLSNFDARIVSIESFDLGGGDDLLNLTSTPEQLGYAVDVTIDGGSGDDYLLAGAGNDTLVGGTGADGIVGWKGDDVLTGGTAGGMGDLEEDNFLFSSGSGGGFDIITDFEQGIDDLFVIGYGVGGGTAADNLADAIISGVVTISVGATDTLVTLDDGTLSTEILLQGVTTSLTADDFAFFA